MTRADLIRLLETACDLPAGTFGDLPGWDVIPVGDAPDGAVMVRGNEIHAGALPHTHGRFVTRSRLSSILSPILRQYGKAITSVCRNNTRGRLFVRRLGFVATGGDDSVIRYELTKVRHV
jgi:hypothetical protein